MGKWTYFIFILLIMNIYLVQCKRGSSSGSWGRRGSSRGSNSQSESGGWLSWGSSSKKTSGSSPGTSSGIQKPAEVKPASGNNYGWQKPAEVAKPAPGASYGWQNPSTNTGKVGTNNQPSSNIGPGGYPVQKAPAPGANPPPYSATNPHGTSYNPGNTRVAPPAYSPGAPPAYSGPKKQVINNHYHYGSPPAYTPSHYGMSSSYYPQQNSFGYPGGYGNSRASYGGMGMFSSGMGGGYGYSGGGNWGGYSNYGNNRGGMGSTTKGILIGVAGGYLASSLVNRLTNPWNYHGHGYGYNYNDRYRADDYRRPEPTTTTPIPPYDPTKGWINCVAFDPATKETLINPNCTCTVTVVTDPMTGQNTSHHDCTPYGQGQTQPIVPQQSPYGVNNPPPTFNGNLYGAGSNYGGGYPVGPPGADPAAGQPVNPGETSTPQTEPLVGDPVAHRRMEFYSQLEKIVNMGHFNR